MSNRQYWDNFYLKDEAPTNNSAFSEYVLQWIKANMSNVKMVDVGSGNGRDTMFFDKNGIDIIGIDLSCQPNDFFIKGDIMEFDYKHYNVLYLRFLVHTLTENELDQLIGQIHGKSYIFIETRSGKGFSGEDKIETNFKSSIGTEHFRMLYSKDYLSKKLASKFEIIEVTEGKDFSVCNNENPYCLRYILKTNDNSSR